MKQIQLVEAYKTLKKMANIPMDITTSFKLMKLKKRLEEYYQFEEQEEMKMFNEFHGELINDGRSMQFPTQEDANAFSKKWQELKDMEVEIEIEPIPVMLDQDIRLTIQDMEALDGFIQFIE